jgi:hypothetical protein
MGVTAAGPRRLLPALGLAGMLALAACGGGDKSPTGPVASAGPGQIAKCLRGAGFDARFGRVRHASDSDPPGQARLSGPGRDEPDGELALTRGSDAALLAYYEDLAKARRLEPELRRNARRFKGVVYRRGRVTAVWTSGSSDEARRDVDACIAG